MLPPAPMPAPGVAARMISTDTVNSSEGGWSTFSALSVNEHDYGDNSPRTPADGRGRVRYMPADALLFDIGDYEAAIREKGLTDGAPLAHAGEYYPQVWPKPIRGERWRVRLGLLKQDGFTERPPVPSS